MTVTTQHVIAAVVSEFPGGHGWPARPVCACGWVGGACHPVDFTPAFHRHVRSAEMATK